MHLQYHLNLFLITLLQKLDKGVFSNNDIAFVDVDSDFVTFFSDDMCLNTINLDNINLDNDNFDENDPPETIIYVRLTAWRNRFIQRKVFKRVISKELIHVTWHPTRWWDWCHKMSQDEKKK